MLKPKELATLRQLVHQDDERLPGLFNALSDPTRCKIFRTLLKKDQLCVSDIASIVDASLSLTSQHLRTLENSHLVVRQRVGRHMYFRPNSANDLVQTIIKAIQ